MSQYKPFQYLLLLGIAQVHSYVLVQVRKDQNKSDVDALIHKVVPSKKFEEIANTARKTFKNYRQFTIKDRTDDKELESIVFAIKTGEQNGGRNQNGGNERKQHGRHDRGRQDKRQNGNETFTNIILTILNYIANPGKTHLPYYKDQLKKINIKPEIVTFRSSDGKPSMMYEIDTNSIIKSITDTISSKQFRRYTEKLIDKAAIAYRMVKEELQKN